MPEAIYEIRIQTRMNLHHANRITIQFCCLYFEGDCVFCFFFFKHLCVCKWMQLLFKCVGIGVYKRCESANLEKCQLTLRKKDKLMANVSFDQDMDFYISVYLLKSQLKLHLFVESRFLCSVWITITRLNTEEKNLTHIEEWPTSDSLMGILKLTYPEKMNAVEKVSLSRWTVTR